MKGLSESQKSAKGIAVKILCPQDLTNRVNEVHGVIAQRAYELFLNRGRTHGRDHEDWLEAESDIVHACSHDLRESAEAVVLRAELPCRFGADQLQVGLGPSRLIVSGETDFEVLCGGYWTAHMEKRTRRILRMHDLSAVVDPSKATATLKGETLEIVMPKATAGGASIERAKAAFGGT